MAVMDEFREEREAIKKGPLKTKLAYFWQYYKWYVIVGLFLAVGLFNYIYNVVTKPDILLEGIILNTYNSEAPQMTEKLRDEFFEKHKIDDKKYDMNLNATISISNGTIAGATDYETSQVLTAWLASGTIDFITGDLPAMTDIAYSNYLMDLRDVLTEEEIEKYEPYFLYVDEAVMFAPENAEIEVNTKSAYPDCTKPEEMERPVPVLIDVTGYKKLEELYNKQQTLVLGIAKNASTSDTLFDFIEFLKK